MKNKNEKQIQRRAFLNGSLVAGGVGLMSSLAFNEAAKAATDSDYKNNMPNVKTTFNDDIAVPDVHPSAYVHPLASVIGNIYLGKRVMVSPCASVRGDEGSPIHIGDHSNIQDCCVVHALETIEGGHEVSKNVVKVNGEKYAVYIGDNVSLAHQSQVHGPAIVEDHVFVGMQALVFKASVGKHCVIEPGAKVIGVKIEQGRYVPAGKVVTKQSEADQLPQITKEYAFKSLNEGVVHVNVQLADGYNGKLPSELKIKKH